MALDINSDELTVIDSDMICDADLPDIIKNELAQIEILDTKLQKAVNAAAQAKSKAQNANIKVGLFNKKEAITLLQEATQGLAEAQISASDAQSISFEYQQSLAKTIKSLFALGAGSIALNRTVVRELEAKLRNASSDEISDIAKQELKNVVLELKRQEDMLAKQKKLEGHVAQHQVKLNALENDVDTIKQTDSVQDEQLRVQQEKDIQHDRLLKSQQEKDVEHDRLLKTQQEKDAEHDALLKTQQEKDAQHDTLLQAQQEKDAEHDALLKTQQEKDAQHDALLKTQQEKDAQHDALLQAQQEKDIQHDIQIATIMQEIELLSQQQLATKQEMEHSLDVFQSDFHTQFSTFTSANDNKLHQIASSTQEQVSNLNAELAALQELINSNQAKTELALDSIRKEIDILTAKSNKIVWKALISLTSVAALILGILQIVGII